MITFSVTTKPAAEPVTFSDLALMLGMDNLTEREEARLTRLLTAARMICERYANKAFITQTITWKSGRFYNPIHLPLPNVLTIESFQYYDLDNAIQTVSTDLYEYDITEKPMNIRLKTEQSWPDVFCRQDAVRIVYTAGYGPTAASVPETTKEAILSLALELYDTNGRLCSPSGIPVGIKEYLNADGIFSQLLSNERYHELIEPTNELLWR